MLAAAGAASLIEPGPLLAQLIDRQPCGDGGPLGTLLGALPLYRDGAPAQPYGVKFGGPGLDARLITDLSQLQPGRLITPNDQAYIRTECPVAVARHQGPWTIKTSGLIARDGTIAFDDLGRGAKAMGAHLFECSGNSNPANFGLISVAEWDGVPLADVVRGLKPTYGSVGVLVGGVDHDGQVSANSVPGASWVFPMGPNGVDRLGAFLATRMNGQPLPADHGGPVRLVVPGWYGCAWIKWVNEIRLVGLQEPATSQMREFAARTHQTRAFDLAREYAPADIQTAATPIRVEKRQGPNGLEYRVVGIVWGGTKPVDRLAIRFGPRDPWKGFVICPAPRTSATWSLWDYRWRPSAPGVYDIALLADATVSQRRLTMGYYVRSVRVDEPAG